MPIRAVSTSLLLPASIVAGFLLAVYGYPLRLPDEPRVAHTSYEMGRTSDWLLPRVNGEPFLQTPPLCYDVLSLWFRCAGTRPEANARIPSVLFTLGTVFLVARRAGRSGAYPDAAFFAAAVLVTTAQFFEIGHTVVVEPGLTFFATLAMLQLETLLSSGRVLAGRSALLGFAAGCAFLSKGLPGPVLVGVVALSTVVCGWKLVAWRPLLASFLIATVVAALTAAPWLVAFARAHPGLLRALLVDHVVGRVLEAEGGKDPSNFTFLHRTLGNLLPWTVLLLFVLYAHILTAFPRLSRRGDVPPDRAARLRTRLRLAWALVPLVLLFFSESKRNLYLAPLLPAFALLSAEWLSATCARYELRRLVAVLFVVCLVAAIAGLVALPLAERLGSGEIGARSLLAAAPLALVCVTILVAPRDETRSRRRLTLCLLVAAVSAWGTARHLARESERSMSDFGDGLARLAAEGHDVIGYRLSEREVGAIAWGLRRPFATCEDSASLAREVRQASAPLVVGERGELSSAALAALAGAPVRLEKVLRRRTLEARELRGR